MSNEIQPQTEAVKSKKSNILTTVWLGSFICFLLSLALIIVSLESTSKASPYLIWLSIISGVVGFVSFAFWFLIWLRSKKNGLENF